MQHCVSGAVYSAYKYMYRSVISVYVLLVVPIRSASGEDCESTTSVLDCGYETLDVTTSVLDCCYDTHDVTSGPRSFPVCNVYGSLENTALCHI